MKSFLLLIGLVLILLGLLLIFFVIFSAIKMRKIIKNHQNSIPKDDLNFEKLVPINLAGLFLSLIGIMILFLIFFLL